MKWKRVSSSQWLLVVSLVVVSCRHDAQASSLQATAVGAVESGATLDVAQAQDEPHMQASLAQRSARISRMEQLGKVELETLLRQQRAVELLAKEEQAVNAEEKKLEETQRRISKKLELISKEHMGYAERFTAALQSAIAARNATQSNASGNASEPEPVEEKENNYREMSDREFLLKVVWGKQSFVSMLFYLCVTMLMAGIYGATKAPIAKLPHDDVHMDQWQYKLMDCHDCGRDWQICCWAMCCSAIRWADTVANPSVAFLTFWPALIFFELMSGMTVISLGITGVILIVVGVTSRQKIRRAYGLPSGTAYTYFWDIFAWTCCTCCAIAQEARQVDLVEALPDLSKISPAPPQQTMRPDGPLTPLQERGPAEPLPTEPGMV